jgi:hypothetical protein
MNLAGQMNKESRGACDQSVAFENVGGGFFFRCHQVDK